MSWEILLPLYREGNRFNEIKKLPRVPHEVGKTQL